jgi:O-antigen ligase
MLGAAGAWAIASSARLLRVRAAAVVLTGGFVAVPFLVYSRSAVVAALAALAWTTIVAAIKWRDRLSFAALGIGLLVMVLVVIVRPGEVASLREVASREVGSVQVSDREQHWRAARAMVAAHPWIGVGPGRFPAEYAAYRTTLGVAGPAESMTHAHNMLLHVAAETGLLALIPFCVIWLRTLVGTLRASVSDDVGVSAFVVHSMLMAFFLRGLTDQFLSDVHSSFRTSMLIGLLLGMAEAIALTHEPQGFGARITAWRESDLKIASPPTQSQGGV